MKSKLIFSATLSINGTAKKWVCGEPTTLSDANRSGGKN